MHHGEDWLPVCMYVYTTYCIGIVVAGKNAKAGKEIKKNRKSKKEKTKLRTAEESGVKKQRNYRVRPQLTHPMIYVGGYSSL